MSLRKSKHHSIIGVRFFVASALSLLLLLSLTSPGLAASKPKAQQATAKIISLELTAGSDKVEQPLHLRGSDARQQLLVTAKLEDGRSRDVTRAVTYEIKPSGVVRIDTN